MGIRSHVEREGRACSAKQAREEEGGDVFPCLSHGVVGLAERQEVVATVDKDVLAGHEVSITLHSIEAVEEGQHRVQESLLIGRRAAGTELRKCLQSEFRYIFHEK